MKTPILFLILVVLLYSCAKKEKTKEEIFFDKIFKSIHYNSIKKDELNWTSINNNFLNSTNKRNFSI